MRDQRTEAQGKDKAIDTPPAIEAGEEAKTNFHAQGTIPPVGSAEPPAPAASASDLAFGDTTGGGGRAAAGAADGSGGGGQPLPDDLRAKFEASLGADLSAVRIHTDGAADKQTKAAGAKATATGQDIHLAPGTFDPHSREGQELLAHEVAHTVQQKNAAPMTQAKKAEAVPAASSGAEREADGAATSMVAGEKAAVTPVGEQKPHAKAGDYNDLITQYKASLNAGNWTDVALRLNGFSDDDIASLVGKMSGGQHAHVREGALAAMPGWSQRVTGAIDAADGNAAQISTLYAAYEKAVAGAKSSGDWHEVIDRLNGMGDWDIQDRLKKLTWFDYEAMRAQTTNARVIAALDKADAQRVQRAYTAYEHAIASHDYIGASKQLHGFSAEDITSHVTELGNKPDGAQQLQYLRAAALHGEHDDRVLAAIDAAIVDHPPDAKTITAIDYTASVAMPDVSDDARQLAGLNLDDFAGNAKIADFCQKLAEHFGAQSAAKSKKPENADVATSGELAKLRASFKSTGEFARGNGQSSGMGYSTLAGFAKDWMSEMREGVDAHFMLSNWHYLKPNPFDPDEKGLEPLHGKTSGHQLVDPWVNKFVDALGDCNAGTYKDHGGKAWGPFCVDLNPPVPKDERGLYQREPLLAYYRRINDAAGGADWASCYNDATVAKAVNADLGVNRVTYAGDDGTGTWHGALKLHLHIYLKPPTGAVTPGDPKTGPDHQEGG